MPSTAILTTNMMENYLGCEEIDIHKTEYAMFSKEDWAMLWIENYGQIDGSHHKTWLIDQIARILKGTKVIVSLAKWKDGTEEYRFNLDKKTKEYKKWVKDYKNGEDGKDTYDYDCGIAP